MQVSEKNTEHSKGQVEFQHSFSNEYIEQADTILIIFGCIFIKILSVHHMPGIRLPRWLSGKEPVCQCRRHKRLRFDPWVRKLPWRRAWQPTPVFLPGKSHGWKSLVGYSPWGHKELDTMEEIQHASALMPGIILGLGSRGENRIDKKYLLSRSSYSSRGSQIINK